GVLHWKRCRTLSQINLGEVIFFILVFANFDRFSTNSALNSAENIIDQQAQKLEEQHKKLHKYSTELKNNTIKNQSRIIIKVASIVGVINLVAVLSVGYLIMQKQPTQPPVNLDSRAVAVSIVEQLRSKR
ncbi:hypothetical protein, partial [Serratia marcescens]|uniref:hypothetical protein n=4 Tax=Serratia TaxID=613 RepID=UPI0020C5C76B